MSAPLPDILRLGPLRRRRASDHRLLRCLAGGLSTALAWPPRAYDVAFASDHLERDLVRRRREGLVEPREVVAGELHVGRGVGNGGALGEAVLAARP